MPGECKREEVVEPVLETKCYSDLEAEARKEEEASFCSKLAAAKISTGKLPQQMITPRALSKCLELCSLPELYILAIALMRETAVMPMGNAEIWVLQRHYLALEFNQLENRLKVVFSLPELYFSQRGIKKWKKCIQKISSLLSGSSRKINIISSNRERRFFESVFAQRYLYQSENAQWFLRMVGAACLPSFMCKDIEVIKGASFKFNVNEYHAERFPSHAVAGRERSAARLNDFDRGKYCDKDPYRIPRSPGIFKSVTPRPMYLYSMPSQEGSVKGSKSDCNVALYQVERHCRRSWVLENLHSPFVSSYSGHAVYAVGWLLHKIDEVPRAIRKKYAVRFLEGFLCSQVSQGFHSYMEVMAVFTDPVILKDLQLKGIGLTKDTLFSDLSGMISDVFAETIYYTVHIVLMRKLMSSFMNKPKDCVVNKNTLDLYERYREKLSRKSGPVFSLLEQPNLFKPEGMCVNKDPFADTFPHFIKAACGCLPMIFRRESEIKEESKIIMGSIVEYALANCISLIDVFAGLKAVKASQTQKELDASIDGMRVLLLKTHKVVPCIGPSR